MSQTLEGEHLYLDSILSAPANNKIIARIDQKFSDSILKSCNKYSLAIDRFRISMQAIPLFIFDNSLDAYSVSISYNGTAVDKVNLTYIPTTPNAKTTDINYWYVWTFDIFIKMVNNAIDTAFTALRGIITLPLGSLPPFFTLDHDTSTIEFNAQSDFYDYTLPLPIKLFMNQKLWRYFDGIPIIESGSISDEPYNNGHDALFIPFNAYNNNFTYGSGVHNNYYKMKSDNGYEVLASWNQSKGFYFMTNNIPIRNEIMPTLQYSNNNTRFIVNNNVIGQPIICNFDFVYSSDSLKPLVAQFQLSTPYKIIDLISETNLRNIDIQVFWYDKYNNSYPLYLNSSDSMSIRLVFMKK